MAGPHARLLSRMCLPCNVHAPAAKRSERILCTLTSQKSTGRTVCRNAFSEVQNLMAGEYPGMEVAPSYYPVSSARQAAVSALSVVQYGAMAAVCFADAVAELLRTRLGVQVWTCRIARLVVCKICACAAVSARTSRVTCDELGGTATRSSRNALDNLSSVTAKAPGSLRRAASPCPVHEYASYP